MNRPLLQLSVAAGVGIAGICWLASGRALGHESISPAPEVPRVVVHRPLRFDVSRPLRSQPNSNEALERAACEGAPCVVRAANFDSAEVSQAGESRAPVTVPLAAQAVEQTGQGKRPPVPLIASFDGLGAGFEGPQGTANFRNPSDNSLAVGPNHIMQIVNSRLAVYTKKGAEYSETGKVLYGPVATDSVFAGFGGPCQTHNNGDAVARYDQLAGRWLIVMPIFQPLPPSESSAETGTDAQGAEHGALATQGQASVAGEAAKMPPNPPEPKTPAYHFHRPLGHQPGEAVDTPKGTFAMCYAISMSSDPLGAYYRYAFERKLFPDYPRPAVWPDGYYIPTSTGDTVIQKHDCIADRNKMLAGQPATEQCLVIDGVNFLNNADIDGLNLPPSGAPNIMMAAGGTQLKGILEDDTIYVWKVHVDWNNPVNTKAEGPVKIAVAPYHYLCDGQLSHCVPQPGTDVRLDVQGDKLMQRLVYRRIGNRESIVAAHSIDTSAGGGGIRWYEFRLDKRRNPYLYQQGTYAPDQYYRFIPSIDLDREGDIGVGYSFGGTPNFAGQRFAARRAKDPRGVLTLHETVLASGDGSQTDGFRWEDYTTTAMDPSDDCTFWHVGDYFKKGDKDYRTRIAALRLPGCKPKR